MRYHSRDHVHQREPSASSLSSTKHLTGGAFSRPASGREKNMSIDAVTIAITVAADVDAVRLNMMGIVLNCLELDCFD